MTGTLFVLARFLLVLLFFLSAFGKLSNVSGVTAVLAARGFPYPMLCGYAFALLELAGALCVLAGFRARAGAVLLFLLTAATILVSHNFWDLEGLERVRNQTQAVKNLAIMGGLLLVALQGAGPWAIDNRRRG